MVLVHFVGNTHKREHSLLNQLMQISRYIDQVRDHTIFLERGAVKSARRNAGIGLRMINLKQPGL